MATKKAMKVNSGQAGKAPFIQARIDRLIDYGDSHVKAYASANIGGAFAIHGIKVIESAKGLFVAMPQNSYMNAHGATRYSDIFHPIRSDARTSLNSKILDAYNQALAQEQTENKSEHQTEEETNDEVETESEDDLSMAQNM